MSDLPRLTLRDFGPYFEALHSTGERRVRPFPWQSRLIRELVEQPSSDVQAWRPGLALPTASGKTACIDIAMFHLALQADARGAERTAPRRVFFCVDRRVIVDEAYDRSRRIARSLRRAKDGVLKAVADRLRHVGGRDDPLEVHQLRGGMYRDDAWARSPLQPTVICTTVDQLGSRLLFRGYGVSPGSAPIHAGLAANDALILLDEAHCAEPFRQTLEAVRLFRSAPWAEEPIESPFGFVELSATPRSQGEPFTLDDEDRAPKHLGPRLSTPKRARLIETKHGTGTDGFVKELSKLARAFASEGARRVAVMVNRVETARRVHLELQEQYGDRVVLLIGRMRPLDRDAVMGTWKDVLTAAPGRPDLEDPVFVVATQCLEVGANLDFDALVTECASLDALRQRFGRLNRLGLDASCWSAVVAPREALTTSDDDPIYGAALHKTWAWLMEHAKGGMKEPTVDFSSDSVSSLLPKRAASRAEVLKALSAPASDAPVMLPAHLDLWCQTSPVPEPDPDVGVFLHGTDHGVPTVSVCWRSDLGHDGSKWKEIASLCPPSSPECMPVPLWLLRSWVKGVPTEGAGDGDLEHVAIALREESEEGAGGGEAARRVLVWRGTRGDSKPTADADEIRPGDVVIVPIPAPRCDFGHLPDGSGDARADRAEQANLMARRRAVLRLRPDLLREWIGPEAEPIIALVDRWQIDDPGRDDLESLRDGLRLLGRMATQGDPRILSRRAVSIIAEALSELSSGGLRRAIREHPAGGLVLICPWRVDLSAFQDPDEETDDFSDEADESSSGQAAVTLVRHTQAVKALARKLAANAGMAAPLVDAVERAAELHDLGKIDPRFQALLGAGRARGLGAEMLAKSPAGVLVDRTITALPEGFRHEMLSCQIAAQAPGLLDGVPTALQGVVLHLIATHHGHGRAMAPVVQDTELPALPAYDGVACVDRGARAAWLPAERLDSGICDRFWELSRRYGWWGLAYLEALLRLADRAVSRAEQGGSR